MPLNKSNFFSTKHYSNFRIFFKIYNLIMLITLFPIILIIALISLIYKIKFGSIETRTLGNCVLPLEIFYNEKKEFVYGDKKELHIWCNEAIVSNIFWLSKIKTKIIVLPGFLIRPIYEFFKKYNFGKKYLIPIRNYDTSKNPFLIKSYKHLSPCSDIHGVLLKHKPLITFNEKEEKYGNLFLSNIGISSNDKIVCIHTRSSSYRNEKLNSLRNSSIKNFTKSIKFLIDKGFKVIRMGRDEVDTFSVNNKNFFDYSSNKGQSDFLDFFIISKCTFFIGAASGLADIAKVYRKPILIHNFFYLLDLIHYTGDSEKIILPKKILGKNKKIQLNYDIFFNEDYMGLSTECESKKIGIEAIENTELEILNSVEEMYNLVINKKKENLDQTKFLMNYKKIFCDFVPNVQIASSFYKENIDLFEKKY